MPAVISLVMQSSRALQPRPGPVPSVTKPTSSVGVPNPVGSLSGNRIAGSIRSACVRFSLLNPFSAISDRNAKQWTASPATVFRLFSFVFLSVSAISAQRRESPGALM